MPKIVTKFSNHKGATYQLAHRSKLKKFFTLEFHLENPALESIDVPHINQSDLLLIFKDGPDTPIHSHMLAVVDSCQDNLLIAKIVLRDAADLDERNYNLYNMLSQGSQW